MSVEAGCGSAVLWHGEQLVMHDLQCVVCWLLLLLPIAASSSHLLNASGELVLTKQLCHSPDCIKDGNPRHLLTSTAHTHTHMAAVPAAQAAAVAAAQTVVEAAVAQAAVVKAEAAAAAKELAHSILHFYDSSLFITWPAKK